MPRTRRPATRTCRLLLAAGAAIACLAAPASAVERPFAPDSPWNVEPARDLAPVPNSRAMVADLARQVSRHGPWINTREFSVPVYTVPADQPRVRVSFVQPEVSGWNHDMYFGLERLGQLQATFEEVPIPPGARPAAGTDRHIVVWQPSTDTMWELWMARDVPLDPRYSEDEGPGWHAFWGARTDGVSTHSGVHPHPFGATASGLALIGGLMRLEEIEVGRIDHALAMAIPEPERGRFVSPANRTDGNRTGLDAIPEGTRLRIDPDLDLDRLALPRLTRIVAEAAQRYGIIVRDYAGAVVLYGEDPSPSHSDVYSRAFGGLSEDQIMAAFPWDRLEVLPPDLGGAQGPASPQEPATQTPAPANEPVAAAPGEAPAAPRVRPSGRQAATNSTLERARKAARRRKARKAKERRSARRVVCKTRRLCDS